MPRICVAYRGQSSPGGRAAEPAARRAGVPPNPMVMLTRHTRRSRRSLYAFRAVMALFGIYFAYHAFHGDHGLLAYAQVKERVERLTADRSALEARKAALEARVGALRSSALDGDLVDERARQTLALIGAGERIVLD